MHAGTVRGARLAAGANSLVGPDRSASWVIIVAGTIQCAVTLTYDEERACDQLQPLQIVAFGASKP